MADLGDEVTGFPLDAPARWMVQYWHKNGCWGELKGFVKAYANWSFVGTWVAWSTSHECP